MVWRFAGYTPRSLFGYLKMSIIAAFDHEFERNRALVCTAVAGLTDEEFFRRPGAQVNSIAQIVKHLAGNLASRWSDFLTSDGEKPWRNRDGEFVIEQSDTRESLMAAFERSSAIVAATLAALTDADLERQITIRGEPHSVLEALLRSSDHTSYHTGQILYLVRLLRPDAPWLTIPPGKSATHQGSYLKQPL